MVNLPPWRQRGILVEQASRSKNRRHVHSAARATLNPTIGTLQLQSSATYVKKNTSYSNIGAFSLDAISTFQLDENANLESPVLLTVTWFSTLGHRDHVNQPEPDRQWKLDVAGSGELRLTATQALVHNVNNVKSNTSAISISLLVRVR